MRKVVPWFGSTDLVVLLTALAMLVGVWVFIAVAYGVRAGSTQRLDDALLRSLRAPADPKVPLGPAWLGEVGRDLSARDLETVEAKLRLICARVQATLTPVGWEPLLERLGVNVADLDAAPEATLSAWAAQLGEIPVPDGHDPAKKILCALLRLGEPAACRARVARSWDAGARHGGRRRARDRRGRPQRPPRRGRQRR